MRPVSYLVALTAGLTWGFLVEATSVPVVPVFVASSAPVVSRLLSRTAAVVRGAP